MMTMTRWMEGLVWREIVAALALLLCMCLASPAMAGGKDERNDSPAVHAQAVGSVASAAPGKEKERSPEGGREGKVVKAHEAKVESAKKAKAETGQGAKAESVKETGSRSHFNMNVLIERLKKCNAIGVFTKLALRSDALDLVDEVHDWRKHRNHVTISEIRARFDGLLLKVLALLDNDPVLSRDISKAREDIWNSLLEVKA